MPAKPPASLVPAIDEESPKRDADPSSDSNQQSAPLPAPLPPDSQAPATDRSGAAPSSDRRRAAIVAEATAARSASIAQQEEFTRRLAAAVVAEHDPAIRSLIVETWMRRGGEDALQVLSQRYREDEDLGVRLRALRALGALKDKAAIPVVVTALDDPDPAVQTRAVQVLKQLTGRDLGNDPQTWRTWAANPDGKPWWNIAEALRSMF